MSVIGKYVITTDYSLERIEEVTSNILEDEDAAIGNLIQEFSRLEYRFPKKPIKSGDSAELWNMAAETKDPAMKVLYLSLYLATIEPVLDQFVSKLFSRLGVTIDES